MPRADDLLRRAITTRWGWRLQELERLYSQYGFVREEGTKHIKFFHPKYPQKWTTVTKSSGDLPPGYVTEAVRLIKAVQELEAKKQKEQEDDD